LNYTAFDGSAPKISVKGPNKVFTSASSVAFSGTTDAVSPANTVKTVRYRVIHDSGAGRYKAAKGTTRWTATITVAPGTSTIELQAVGDNGARTDRRRTVVR
jgi:hypothetical protein